jgi:hypothetical protein
MARLLPFSLLLAVLFLLPAGPAVGQGFSPEEAVKRMQLADGLRAKLVAASRRCASRCRSPSTTAAGCG